MLATTESICYTEHKLLWKKKKTVISQFHLKSLVNFSLSAPHPLVWSMILDMWPASVGVDPEQHGQLLAPSSAFIHLCSSMILYLEMGRKNNKQCVFC